MRECRRRTGPVTSSGGWTDRAPGDPTSSGANSVSRTTRACLQRALREFSATGLSIPWLSCFGNHEALNQGVGTQTPGLAAALTGGQKPTGLPEDFHHDRALELFTERPEAFMACPLRPVTPDPFRRPISRRDFVDAHLRAG